MTYNLDELVAICSEATPGPWPESYEREKGTAWAKGPLIKDRTAALEPDVAKDAKFIAAAREMMPALLSIALAALECEDAGAINPKGKKQDEAAMLLMSLLEEVTFVREVPPDAG